MQNGFARIALVGLALAALVLTGLLREKTCPPRADEPAAPVSTETHRTPAARENPASTDAPPSPAPEQPRVTIRGRFIERAGFKPAQKILDNMFVSAHPLPRGQSAETLLESRFATLVEEGVSPNDEGVFEINLECSAPAVLLHYGLFFSKSEDDGTRMKWVEDHRVMRVAANREHDAGDLLIPDAPEFGSLSGSVHCADAGAAEITGLSLVSAHDGRFIATVEQYGIFPCPRYPFFYRRGNEFLVAHLEPGSYTLLVGAGYEYSGRYSFHVARGRNISDIRIVLDETPLCARGTVRDATSGKPLPGICMDMYPNEGLTPRPLMILTDEEGRYELPVVDFPEGGEMTVWVYEDEWRGADKRAEFNCVDFAANNAVVRDFKVKRRE
ncbi:MAG: hypothetical protein ACYTAF_09295 [Planctomycetota bacterium]|jgi:hypothetical protein